MRSSALRTFALPVLFLFVLPAGLEACSGATTDGADLFDGGGTDPFGGRGGETTGGSGATAGSGATGGNATGGGAGGSSPGAATAGGTSGGTSGGSNPGGGSPGGSSPGGGSPGGSSPGGGSPGGSSPGGGSPGGSSPGGSTPGGGTTGGGSPGGGTPGGGTSGGTTGTGCPPGQVTSVSGVVYGPGGSTPLPDVLVYVPTQPLAPVPEGASCAGCAPSGAPGALTTSAVDGKFKLDGVPATANVPIVFQIGRWRRKVLLPAVTACQDNAITNHDYSRLPKNRGEGDIPHIAVATGGCDAYECMLRGMGLDDAEFTDPSGPGRIHLYRGEGESGASSATPAATDLWSNPAKLAGYDVVVNGCECAEYENTKPIASLANMAEYVRLGGRMMATHFQKTWLVKGPPAMANAAAFTGDGLGPDQADLDVDTTHVRGNAFASWLLAVGASTAAGRVHLTDLRYDVGALAPWSEAWLRGPDGAGVSHPIAFTFDPDFAHPGAPPSPSDGGVAVDSGVVWPPPVDSGVVWPPPVDSGVVWPPPVDSGVVWPAPGDAGVWPPPGVDAGAVSGPSCGRVAFADFHTSSLGGGNVFPAECSGTVATPQQRVAEFLFFELNRCR